MTIHVPGRQRDVLTFVYRYRETHDVAPTEAEIAVGLGMSHKSLAGEHVRKLVRRGLIDRKPRAFRSLRVTALGQEALGFPVAEHCYAADRRTDLLTRAAEFIESVTPHAPLLTEIRNELSR